MTTKDWDVMRGYRYLTNTRQALLWLLITGALVALLLSAFLPALSYLAMGLLLFPILLLFVSALGGILPALMGLLLMVWGAVQAVGPGGLWVALYLLPMTAAFLICLEQKVPFFRTAGIVLAAFVTSMLLIFIVLQRQAGGNVYQAASQAAVEGLREMTLRDNLLYTLWRNGFISHGLPEGSEIFVSTASGGWTFEPEVLEEFYKQVSSRLMALLAALLPGLLTSFAISVSLMGSALALKLAARYQTAPSLGMPPFSMWFLPRSVGRRLVVLALGYLVAMFSRNLVLQTAGQLMYNVFFALYGIQGLSYLNFVLKRRGSRRGLRFVLLLLLFTLVPPAAMFLGVYDQTADPRKLRGDGAPRLPV